MLDRDRCLADARARVDSAARAAAVDERVEAVDTIRPDDGPTQTWGLELTLAPEAGGVPPALQRELAARELTVRESAPKQLHWRAVVTA